MGEESGLAHSTTVHAELLGPVPRNVRMTGTGWANVVFIMILFGLAGASVVLESNEPLHLLAKRNALRFGASESIGQVTREWITGQNSRTQHIGYEFEVDGTAYSGEATVPDEIWKSLKQTSEVNIKYSPADPRINHPTDWEDSPFEMWPVLLILPLMFSLAGLNFAWQLRTQRRMVSMGTPALARVTERTKGHRGGTFLNYEFRAEDGENVNGNCLEEARQEVGSVISVIYLPGNPRTSLPYPVDTFKVAQ